MGDLGAWLSLLVIAVLLWKVGSERLGPFVRPVASMLGQALDYAAPLVLQFHRGNLPETKSMPVIEPVTALESEVTAVTEVPEVTLKPEEIVRIMVLLQKGMAPSRVAKELPGYTPKRYKEFAGKVDQVSKLIQATVEEIWLEQPEIATKP